MLNWFNVRKAAQVAAYFTLSEGKKINVLKLAKLIYLADRRFMEKYDCPILNDRFVAMPHGPVNSQTLNYINGCAADPINWDPFISDRSEYSVGLANRKLSFDSLNDLSDAEVEVLREIWSEFGDKDGFSLADYTHKHCPEWEDPDGSSNPIPYERVFKFLGKSDSDFLADKVYQQREIDRLFSME